MTESLTEAILGRQAAAQARPKTPFEPDPALELQAERLERLRQTDPPQYAAPGLADLKEQVFRYYNRKAQAEADASGG